MTEQIGDFRVVDKLGEGAAGEVFLATPVAPKAYARPGDLVAIKRYKPEILQQARQFDRIEREFKVGSQFSHPNLVRMHEYVPAGTSDSAPFLVMEYVDGIPLDKWIEQFHPAPRRLVMRFVSQLLSAVSHLHDNGVRHRDIKPANALVTSNFDVKLMDLGVVQILSDSRLTPEESFIGTIRNSSPEMLFGRSYDDRTDLYSLGTIIYALLHGEQVFADEGQWARLTRLIETDNPRFDPAVKATDGVSSILFDAAQKLLNKLPEKRPGTCADVRSLLERANSELASVEPIEPLHGYIATALTGLDPDSREAIMFVSSKIAETAKEYGLYVYQPRKATDPQLNKGVDPRVVYRLDRERVVAADLLFVIANRPSFGVGQEIEIATSHSIPTILLVREDSSTVSRMVTGSPAHLLDDITYATPEDLERKLRRSLGANLGTVRRWKTLVHAGGAVPLGHRLTTLRTRKGYGSPGDLADSLGVSPRLLEAIEKGYYQSASIDLIERIAVALGASLNDLFGDEMPKASRNMTTPDANLKRLENTAKKAGWNADSFIDLRDDYLRQLAASGEGTNISEDQWVARHRALEARHLRESEERGGRRLQLFPDDADRK
ncbi:MAG TPA: protein kinase [Pirellulales bacterium]|nr:protein kinase [Pirellulales bacterium]